jgi:signal transduction histidine kinase
MGCILGISGLGVYQIVAYSERETIDRGLESVAEALHQSIEPVWQQPKHLQQLAEQLSLELCTSKTSCLMKTAIVKHPLAEKVNPVNYYLRLLDREGKPIAIAGINLEQLSLSSPALHWQTLSARSGSRYRQIILPLRTQNRLSGYLEVGRSLNDIDKHLDFLRLTLLLGCPIILLLIAISSWWLAGLAMQPVYRSYHQMEQFTADAAHEFRTPLAAMYSTIQAAMKLYSKSGASSLSEPAGERVLEVLKRQISRLSQLVGDLLLLTRLERQKLTGEYVPCCLNDIISDLVEELAFLAVEANVTLTMQIEKPEKIYVLGNEEQLYRLVSNLIVNAIQATPSGGKVTISLERSDCSALIQVQDTGMGIAPEHQRRIFDRFYRVNCDRSRHTGGSGLGLAIAQAIVWQHKGEIAVSSQVGIGSCFEVRLRAVESKKL